MHGAYTVLITSVLLQHISPFASFLTFYFLKLRMYTETFHETFVPSKKKKKKKGKCQQQKISKNKKTGLSQ